MASNTDELEDFKILINLSQYAAAQGYTLDPKSSSRNSAVMVNTAGDKIIIAKGHDRHWVYFSVHQAADPGGSIIDFVQHRGGGSSMCSLGNVRQELRPWLKHTPPLLSENLPPEDSYAVDLQPLARDLLQVRARIEDSVAIDGHHRYLCEQRMIPAALLGCERFLGRVRSDEHGNVIFPHWNEDGISGYEVKNAGFTGFAPGGIKGLWGSRKKETDCKLVISETAIDSMSYAALHGHEQSRFVSTAGQMSPTQPGLLKRAMEGMPDGSEIVAAVDHDKAGKQMADAIKTVYDDLGRLGDAGLVFRVHMPSDAGNDWNDALRASVGRAGPTPEYE
ncbi:MAG: DUF3991 and TOPRIM domain-containing protein [Phycisphaerales bacterium]|nr:DUF3991 and TOPRIM domain-containing protein [Phycisphaerales bacterium]